MGAAGVKIKKGVLEFGQELANRHISLLKELSHQYPRKNLSAVGDAVLAFDQLVGHIQTNLPPLTSGPKNDRALPSLAYRSLERSLALVSIIDRRILIDGNLSPFSGLIRDCFRLLKQMFDERPVNWPNAVLARNVESREIISGILIDNLVVLEDLQEFLQIEFSRKIAMVEDYWGHGLPAFRDVRAFMGVDRIDTLSLDEFATALASTRSKINTAVTKKRILAVKDWSGVTRFPRSQLVDDTVPTRLPELLQMVDRDAIPDWHLAFFLGSPFLGSTQRVIDILDSRFDEVVNWLRTSRAILNYVGDPASPVKVPKSTELSSLPRRLKLGVRRRERFFRITHYENGPFYFSTGPHRFDLTDHDGEGTCYLACSEEGAFGEVLNKRPILDVEHVFRLSMWDLAPLNRLSPILDLTSEDVRGRIHLNIRLPRTLHRKVTQELAAGAHSAGFRAIRFNLLEADGVAGLALFGKAGRSVPDQSGLPTFFAQHRPVSSIPGFWSWLRSRVDQHEGLFVAFQLPDGSPVSVRRPV